MKILNSFFKAIKTGMYGFILVAGMFFAFNVLAVAFEASVPDTWYVEYDGITSYAKYKAGEQPKFFSQSRYPRGGTVIWLDVMRCDTNGDGKFDFFSSFKSSTYIEPRNEPLDNSGWLYQGRIPEFYSACFVESNITVETEHGAIKRESVKTDIFYFVEEETDILQPV